MSTRVSARNFTIEPEHVILDRIAGKGSQINFDRIGSSVPEQRDDLQQIKGIGAFTVKKLNALGIYTFTQIANMTPDDCQIVNEAIEYFPGRIQREDWVGQARIITGMLNEDELTKIEGVGPKIQELLKGNGIKTFMQLANTPTETLKAILEAAGSSYQIHDPATWSAQAKLAAQNRWTNLKTGKMNLKAVKPLRSNYPS